MLPHGSSHASTRIYRCFQTNTKGWWLLVITSHWCLLPIIQPHLAHDGDDGDIYDDDGEDGVYHLLIYWTILFLEWLFQDGAMSGLLHVWLLTYEREQTRFIHLRWSCWWWHQAEEDAQSSVGSRLFVTLAYHGSMLLHLTIPSLFYFIVPYRGYVVILWLAYQFHPTISTLPCLVAII